MLLEADRFIEHYGANNDIIDYINNDGKDEKEETGLFRAEVTIVESVVDDFTKQTILIESKKILGYYVTAELASQKIKVYQKENSISNVGCDVIAPEPYIDPMDPVRLKRENAELILKCHRRTVLLENLRRSYLEDVVLMKEQLRGCSPTPQKFLLPAEQLPCLKGLDFKLLDRMLPRFDLRNSLPLFAPTNTALLAVTPCQFCGGTVDVACFDEVAVKVLRDEHMSLKRIHTRTVDDLDAAKGAVLHLQVVCGERIKQADAATELVSKLRINVRRLMNETAKDWLGMHGTGKVKHEEREAFLWDENVRLEKEAAKSLKGEKNAREAQTTIMASLDVCKKECTRLAKSLMENVAERDKKILMLESGLKEELEGRQTAESSVARLEKEMVVLKEAKARGEEISEKKRLVAKEAAEKKEYEWKRKFQVISQKMKIEKTRGVTDRKSTGRTMLMKVLSTWGLRRNQRYFEHWMRYRRETVRVERATKDKDNRSQLRHVHEMLSDARRLLGVEHVLRKESVAREGAMRMKLLSQQDMLGHVRQRASKERRKNIAKEFGRSTAKNMMAETLRRQSIRSEQILIFNNGRLTLENHSLRSSVVETVTAYACHNLISTAVETATTFATLHQNESRKRKQEVKNVRAERKRKELMLERERRDMNGEDIASELRRVTQSIVVPLRWCLMCVRILHRLERREKREQEEGWNVEIEKRKEDQQAHEKRMLVKDEKLEVLLEQLEAEHCELLKSQKENERLEELMKSRAKLRRALEDRVAKLMEERKNVDMSKNEIEEVVECLSNKIITERKHRNQLFTDATCHVVDVLLATANDDDDDDEEEMAENVVAQRAERVERVVRVVRSVREVNIGARRSSAKDTCLKSMPEWSKTLQQQHAAQPTSNTSNMSSDKEIIDDISTLKNDLDRIAANCWEQRGTVITLKKIVRQYQEKVTKLKTANTKIATKLRRVTLSLPTEVRRKILVFGPKAEKEREETIRKDLEAGVMKAKRLKSKRSSGGSSSSPHLGSPIGTLLTGAVCGWSRLSPL